MAGKPRHPRHRHEEKIFQPFIGTTITNELNRFLQQEAHRLSRKMGRAIRRGDIVRALIAAYYEKRAIGLLVDPDD
jgi:hypothetical protein